MAFKPGESGNPGGARKPRLFYDALRTAMDKKTLRDIAEQLVSAARKGEQWAIRELIDRIDGKAAQTLDVSGVESPVRYYAELPQKARSVDAWAEKHGEPDATLRSEDGQDASSLVAGPADQALTSDSSTKH